MIAENDGSDIHISYMEREHEAQRNPLNLVYKCPAIESSAFLCDRIAEYLLGGTAYCHWHARRMMGKGKL
jgi:hypothetical protein